MAADVTANPLPLVSIGIPTRARPTGLERTLRDLCAQTHAHLEIIVSDNATPGPEVEMLMRRWLREDTRIRFFAQPQNLGIFGNFQFVLAQARGEFFLWAADDDEWEPDFIERCLALAGTQGSVMSGFRTHLRASGELLDNPVPALDPALGAAVNVERFLALMQPSLFYGLHRRAEIGFVLGDEFFDYYDCYFVLRQILGPGFRTFAQPLYRAGVDAPAREIKYADDRRRRLDYGSVLLRGAQALLAAPGLAPGERLRLLRRFWAVMAEHVRHHDAAENPLRRLLGDALRRLRRGWPAPAAGQGAAVGADPAPDGKPGYAQSGEDAIADFVFHALGIARPSYLDIGAHHPSRLSNTFRFYGQGCRGVCVEPDPDLYAVLAERRPNDIHLNAGIGAAGQAGGSLPFYVMSERTLNTFSKAEAERYAAGGRQRIETVIEVPVLDINTVCDTWFAGAGPDFLSVDVEGLDEEIVRALDLSRFRPAVICVETLTYSESRQERKLTGIAEHLLGQGYFVYADTYINTVFVDRARWQASA